MIDLQSEMEAATSSVRQVHLDRLRALGVSTATIADLGRDHPSFGVVKAEPVDGGLFQPGEGDLHVVLPVLEDGALVDLVAFRSTSPDDWTLRTGNGWALGLNNGVGWHTWAESVHVSATPLDWLRNGAAGLCVLDWRSPELPALDVLQSVTVPDHATATLLRDALTRPVRLPHIEVKETRVAA